MRTIGLNRIASGALPALALLALPAIAPAAMPSYANGLITCTDGTTHRWPEKGVSIEKPSDAEMVAACNNLDVKLTPASPDNSADVYNAANEIIALRPAPAAQPAQLTDAQIKEVADDQALAGRYGTIAKLRTAWRLGKTNVLAEAAGRALFWIILGLVAIFLMLRRGGSQA